MMTAPCKNRERKGCGSYHDKCEEFKEYRNEIDKARQKKDSESVIYRPRGVKYCKMSEFSPVKGVKKNA